MVVSFSAFKFVFCHSDIIIYVFFVCSYNFPSVNYTIYEAISLEGAGGDVTAIAFSAVGLLITIQYLCVVRLNVGCKIRHAAIADFDIIFIENLMKFIVLWEMLSD